MRIKYREPEHDRLATLIRDARVAHVGVVVDGNPVVFPTAVAWHAQSILLHGSTGSRWMRLVADGVAMCVTVTSLDALVVARSAFESSMHYRSAVVFGTCFPLEGSEKAAALDVLTDTLIPGRVAEVRKPWPAELAATLVMRMAITDWTYKVSDGWPDDVEQDIEGPTWAGVLPLRVAYAAAKPAPDLARGIPVPPSVSALITEGEPFSIIDRT